MWISWHRNVIPVESEVKRRDREKGQGPEGETAYAT